MNKTELAGYLINLHSLMEAQKGSNAMSSTVLADEYEKHWNLLKAVITKENERETRQS